MKDIALIIALIGAATCAIFALELLARNPMLVAGLILLYGGITTIFRIDFRLATGSITIFPPDIIFSLVAGAAFIRFLGLPRLSFVQMCLVGLGLLGIFSVARGASPDIATAVNEFRSTFYFLAGTLYFATVHLTEPFLGGLTKLLFVTALLMLTGSVILWGEFFTGASLPEIFENPWEGGFRVITADRAMILVQATLVALPAWLMRKRGGSLERYLPFLLVPAILLVQWRVIWVMFVLGLIVLSVRYKTMTIKVIAPLVVTLALAVFLLPKVFSGDDTPSLRESFETTTESAEGTFLWRVEGWRELTKGGPESASEFFLGAPFGRGLDRVVQGKEITTQAHSFYVNTYLRMGLIGLVLLVLAYGWAIRRLVSMRNPEAVGLADPTIMLVIVITQLIIFITFTPGEEQGLLAGIAFSFAAHGVTGKDTNGTDRRSAVPIHTEARDGLVSAS